MKPLHATTIPITKKAPKKISILGATGTIGINTLDLIKQSPESYEIQSITAGRNVTQLIEVAKQIRPKFAAIQDESLHQQLKDGLAGTDIETGAGQDAVIEAASASCDLLMSGIVGIAALEPTLAAIKSGNNVALANKECLVCAGELITSEAKKRNVTILPVDSEHNAIFQAFDFENPERVEKITLTASGGPFYRMGEEQKKNATPEQAIKHPNWKMGAKISIDSATMMNKGLEIIEAYHLFPIKKEQIEVVVHPESVIHCLVSFIDGSVIAQMSVPDMRVPIAYSLAWPDRIKTNTSRLDLAKIGKLTFETPDENAFPALRLAREVLENGGSAPIVFNAVNEVAVDNFINKKIGFLDIVKLIENALQDMPQVSPSNLEDVLEVDRKARELALDLIKRGI